MGKRRILSHAFALGAAGALLLAACEPIDDRAAPADGDRTVERLTDEIGETLQQADEVYQRQQNRFIEQASVRLREIREQLAEARKREDIPEDMQKEFYDAAEQLEDDIARLEEELRRLSDQGSEARRDIEPRIRDTLAHLSESYRKFRDTYLAPRER